MRVRMSLTNPESDEVPGPPLSTLRLDRFQVVVREQELCIAQAGLARYGKLIRPMSELRILDFLHCDGSSMTTEILI